MEGRGKETLPLILIISFMRHIVNYKTVIKGGKAMEILRTIVYVLMAMADIALIVILVKHWNE